MPKKSKYPQTPMVPDKAIAGSNPVGGVALGSAVPGIVPQGPEKIHGFDVPPKTFGHPNVKGAHGYGHVAKRGHHRLSGNTGAHQVGFKNR